MSIFRINTNVMALNASRNLGLTSTELAKSVTRLSTGYRINSAADGPADLIVSESFRAQISGIDQAIRNNQDAINYAKTADSALDESLRLLRDARALAVASANDATLDDAQRKASQDQLNSIALSLTRIANTTAYGTRKLLDGSAGTYAVSTSASNVSSMFFTGMFNGDAITSNSTVTVNVTTAATQASIVGTATFAAATTTVAAGSFNINGVTFATSSSDTIAQVVQRINDASSETGVTATFSAGGAVTLQAASYGSDGKVNLVDSSGILLSAAGATNATGTDAVATVSITTSSGVVNVTFNKGKGLSLRDADGNAIQLTENGNLASGANALGQIYTGSSLFQVGGNVNETAALSLSSYAASNLGLNAVSGKNMSNLSLLTASDAADALKVIDKAISDVSDARGRIGNFQRNILESSVRSLGVAKESLLASESSIRDVNFAEEITKFTNAQILQQSGISILAQANFAPQQVLSLLR
jgi:flagellin